jgi:hypothetical protein
MQTGFFAAAVALAAVTAALQSAPQPVTPTAIAPGALKPEMAALAFFVGPWECEGEFTATKKPTAAHVSFSPELDGAWLAMRWDDRAPGVFRALEMWGFDKTAQRFTNFIYDNFGGMRRFASAGWEGDTWTWTANPLTTPPPRDERFVFERQAGKRFVVSWQVRQAGGEWKTGDTLTCHP